MKRAQPTMAERVKQAQIDDRVARARKANPEFDATGKYLEALRELADQTGLDVSDLLDDWTHASGCRLYEAGMTLIEAERQGLEDIKDRLIRQRRLAV